MGRRYGGEEREEVKNHRACNPSFRVTESSFFSCDVLVECTIILFCSLARQTVKFFVCFHAYRITYNIMVQSGSAGHSIKT